MPEPERPAVDRGRGQAGNGPASACPGHGVPGVAPFRECGRPGRLAVGPRCPVAVPPVTGVCSGTAARGPGHDREASLHPGVRIVYAVRNAFAIMTGAGSPAGAPGARVMPCCCRGCRCPGRPATAACAHAFLAGIALYAPSAADTQCCVRGQLRARAFTHRSTQKLQSVGFSRNMSRNWASGTVRDVPFM